MKGTLVRAVVLLALVVLGGVLWWQYQRFKQSGSEMSASLLHLPGVVDVHRDGPSGKASARIVHILDWHFVPRDLFALDLRQTQPRVTEAELEKAYAEHLDTVEAIQVEQRELLAALLKEQGVRTVLAEGLTPEGLGTWRERVEWLREAEEQQPKLRELRADAERRGRTDLVKQADALLNQPRLDRLELGTAGWLASKGLAEGRPLDDADALEAADLRRTGGLLDPVKVRARQVAIVRRVLAEADPVVVLILGGAHDLTEEVRRQGNGKVECLRVTTRRYREAAGE